MKTRKLITEDKLNEDTLRALNEEKERQERLNNAINTAAAPSYTNNQTSFNPMLTLYPQQQYQQHPMVSMNSFSSADQAQPLDFNDDLKLNDFDLLTEAIAPLPPQTSLPVNTFKSELISMSTPAEVLNSSSDQSVCVLEDEANISARVKTRGEEMASEAVEVIELDDDDESDQDCMIISESEHLQEDQAASRRKLRGIHMNDELNRPDANGQVLVNGKSGMRGLFDLLGTREAKNVFVILDEFSVIVKTNN